jgi:hypothetical protein
VRGLSFGLVVAGTALVGVATALAAVRLPATPGEARLVEAAVAALGPARAAPATVGSTNSPRASSCRLTPS